MNYQIILSVIALLFSTQLITTTQPNQFSEPRRGNSVLRSNAGIHHFVLEIKSVRPFKKRSSVMRGGYDEVIRPNNVLVKPHSKL